MLMKIVVAQALFLKVLFSVSQSDRVGTSTRGDEGDRITLKFRYLFGLPDNRNMSQGMPPTWTQRLTQISPCTNIRYVWAAGGCVNEARSHRIIQAWKQLVKNVECCRKIEYIETPRAPGGAFISSKFVLSMDEQRSMCSEMPLGRSYRPIPQMCPTRSADTKKWPSFPKQGAACAACMIAHPILHHETGKVSCPWIQPLHYCYEGTVANVQCISALDNTYLKPTLVKHTNMFKTNLSCGHQPLQGEQSN